MYMYRMYINNEIKAITPLFIVKSTPTTNLLYMHVEMARSLDVRITEFEKIFQ